MGRKPDLKALDGEDQALDESWFGDYSTSWSADCANEGDSTNVDPPELQVAPAPASLDEEHLQFLEASLLPATRAKLDAAVKRWGTGLGRAAQRELRQVLTEAAAEAVAPSSRVLFRAWRAFLRRHGPRLGRECRDEQLRDRAATDDSALAAYACRWEKRVAAFQIAYPRRWRAPGMTPDEVKAALLLKLIEAVRQGGILERFARTGMEATYGFLASRARDLRRDRRIYEVLGADLPDLMDDAPRPDELYEARERDAQVRAVLDRGDLPLSKTQKRWFWRFRADVHQHGDLNLARVAASHGQARSSALRARDAIRNALASLGVGELFQS